MQYQCPGFAWFSVLTGGYASAGAGVGIAVRLNSCNTEVFPFVYCRWHSVRLPAACCGIQNAQRQQEEEKGEGDGWMDGLMDGWMDGWIDRQRKRKH